jgi:ligand-binding sensor domain-containing protein/serine phosphatase RsbU (regulator of sigma subunit)
MRKCFAILWILPILFLNLGFVYSQNSEINISKFSIEDGLSQNQISDIIQDSNGFLWIGTQDGLNKYDGYSFKVYRHNPLDSNSISSNRIKCIIEDYMGNIWIGTRAGLNKFIRKSAKFKTYAHDPSDIMTISHDNIEGLCQDHSGKLWIKTKKKLDMIVIEDDKLSHFDYYDDIFTLAADNKTYNVIEDYKGNIWFGTKDGLNLFDPYNEQIKRFYHDNIDPGSLSDNDIRVIFEDSKHQLYVGTAKGLNIYNRKVMSFTRQKTQEETIQSKINDIYEDNEGAIWIGTDNGLKYYDQSTGLFTSQISVNHIDLHNTLDLKISKIYQDYSSIFWIGTWQGNEVGLYKIDGNRKKFKLYKNKNHNGPGFLSNNISSVILDGDDLWIGNKNSGLNVYNRKTGEIKHFTTSNAPLPDNHIQALFKDDIGDIWVGTMEGIRVFDKKNNRFILIEQKLKIVNKRIFRKNRVSDITQDSKGNFWIATQRGVYLVNKDIFKRYAYVENNPNSLSNSDVHCVIEDKDELIWVGTAQGLNLIDPESDKITHFLKSYKTKKGLSNNTISNLHEGKDGKIWIGTESGVNCYDKTTGEFKFYTQSDGLANDFIYGILEDKNEVLWISTNRGLSKFDPELGYITNYDINDGLQAYEFNQGACFKSDQGELFFGGVAGLNSFFPDSIYKNKFIPKMSITSVEKVNDHGITKEYIDDLTEIIINPEDYLFTIEFSALEFNRPEKNNYKYILEGFDEDWINVGTKHYAPYTKIPPGSYTFKAKGSNNDLIWNQDGISVEVIVKPSLFNSNWSYVLYFIVFVGSIFLIMQIRTRNLRSSYQVLKEKQIAALEIAAQKEELAIKNKNITDSLNYAQRIIQAMIPSIKNFKKTFTDSFILYQPKDIVSGDFYWYSERGDKVFFTAVDCTGHGIPGAFMSIIGFDLLRNIVNVHGVEDPSEILNQLNKGVADTFRDSEDLTVSDGMDLSFCVFDRKKRTIEYAGAFNPLYLIRDNNIVDYKADRFSVGLAEEVTHQSFKKQTIDVQEGDAVYIFSDGYADQFGGPKGKKFKYRRFRHLLLTIHKLSMEQQYISLRDSMVKWRGGFEQVDDILVIGIKF